MIAKKLDSSFLKFTIIFKVTHKTRVCVNICIIKFEKKLYKMVYNHPTVRYKRYKYLIL